MIVTISGKAGSGKDEVARIIQERLPALDWQVKRWADKLKVVAGLILNTPAKRFEDRSYKESELGSEWDYMTVREFLQKLGTDGLRNGLHQNTWVNALMADYSKYMNWIITDTRFPNELTAAKRRHAITVRVERMADIKTWMEVAGIGHLNKVFRANTGPITKNAFIGILEHWNFKEKDQVLRKLCHPSEIAVDTAKYDVTIFNNGTLQELDEVVEMKLVPVILKYQENGESS